jgi:hypothetical protein
MIVHLSGTGGRVERPPWVWLAVAMELFTALTAVPVGWLLMTDPSGSGIGLPEAWIRDSVFGSYLVPGVYLFAMNGLGMIAAAALTVARHWLEPWLTGALGVGLIVWIAVQLLIMPETMVLQWIFLACGLGMGVVALFWLRRTGQLRLWGGA